MSLPHSFACHRLLLIAWIVGMTLVSPFAALAAPLGSVKDIESFKITNKTGQAAKDFHLVITSATDEFQPTKITNDGGFTAQTTNTSVDGVLTIDFEEGNVNNNADLKAGIELKGIKNKVGINRAFWTDGAGANIGGVAIPGFKASGDPIYTIFNDLDTSLGIRGLQFLVNSPELPLESLDPGAMSGFSSPLSDFVLAPGGMRTFEVPGTVDPGRFFYAQGTLFDVSSDDVTGAFIHGSLAVSEPGSLVLLMTGMVWMLGVACRSRTKGGQGKT